MRSSKSRSRSKSNRNRSMGNIVNRVFDSSGPEGKVRGTPQQVIDKYNQLARDAQLAGDRVATENFQQHAEHYVRLLNEAQREQQERQQQNQQNQGGGNQNRGDGGQGDQPSGDDGRQDQGRQDQNRQRENAKADASGDVMDVKGDDSGSTLVETPESRPRQRRSRKPKGGGDQQQAEQGSGGDDAPTEAAE